MQIDISIKKTINLLVSFSKRLKHTREMQIIETDNSPANNRFII